MAAHPAALTGERRVFHESLNGVGESVATQLVSGESGVRKNDATTFCAHSDANTAAWPTAGIVMTVEWVSCRAA